MLPEAVDFRLVCGAVVYIGGGWHDREPRVTMMPKDTSDIHNSSEKSVRWPSRFFTPSAK
jgi:hypothetical protein